MDPMASWIQRIHGSDDPMNLMDPWTKEGRTHESMDPMDSVDLRTHESMDPMDPWIPSHGCVDPTDPRIP